MNRNLVLAVLLVATAYLVQSKTIFDFSNRNYDLTAGTLGANDTLIADVMFNRAKQFLRVNVQNYILVQTTTPARNITYIHVTNLLQKGGATPLLLTPGIGTTSVTIQFTSKFDQPIFSRIQIYGPTA